jgi:hypothetical protein
MFNALVRGLMRRGFREGLAGSRGWLLVGIAAAGVRTLNRLAQHQDQVLYRTVIKVGDVFEIVTSPPPK